MSGLKASTIKMILRKKINNWLATISDEKLKDMIKSDAIVSGGAIACMLSGDKVNDYDIYFRTRETTLAVARYYTHEFNIINEIEEKTGDEGVKYFPHVVERDVENIRGETEKRVCIHMQSAGVAAEDQDTYQYFESEPDAVTAEFIDSLGDDPIGDAEEVRDITKDKKCPYRPVFLSENAVTLKDKMQLVIRFYGEPDEIHDNYDYIHATCWYRYADDCLYLPGEALQAILSKTLIYRGSLYPLASVFRIRKFLNRGWRITAGQILKILFQISEIDLKDRNILREQLIGVDQAYMTELLRAIENSDQRLDATYLASLIDKIFEEM